jgi:integrase
MLEHADQDEGVFLKFLLVSGFRDREVRHVTWRDMDFRNSLVRVVRTWETFSSGSFCCLGKANFVADIPAI